MQPASSWQILSWHNYRSVRLTVWIKIIFQFYTPRMPDINTARVFRKIYIRTTILHFKKKTNVVTGIFWVVFSTLLVGLVLVLILSQSQENLVWSFTYTVQSQKSPTKSLWKYGPYVIFEYLQTNEIFLQSYCLPDKNHTFDYCIVNLKYNSCL